MLGIFHSVLACNASALEVAGIYLYSRFVGEHLEQDACDRRIERGAYLGVVALSVLVCVQTPVMVVASGVLYLLICSVVDCLADGMRLAEVHRCALHRLYLARCHVCVVGRGEIVGIDIQHHVCSLFRRVAVEVEVAVIGHVYHRLLVCRCLESDVESIVAEYLVCCSGLHCSREVVVAVRRHESHDESSVVGLFCIIHLIHPSRRTAMQAMAEVVLRQLVVLAVHVKMALVYSVGISAHGRSVVARTVHRVGILPDVVVAEHHVSRLAVLVGNGERYHSASKVCDAYFHPTLVLEREKFDGLVVDGCVECGRVEARLSELCVAAC